MGRRPRPQRVGDLHRSHRALDDASPELGQGVTFVRTLRLLSLAMLQRNQKVQLERAARHDRLTGLANRSRFFAALSTTLTTARPGSAAVVAQRLSALVGPADLVARISGDELAVLCPDLAPDDPPGRLAEQLIEAVSQPIELAAHGHDRPARGVVVVGLSIGVAVIADPSSGVDLIVQQRIDDELVLLTRTFVPEPDGESVGGVAGILNREVGQRTVFGSAQLGHRSGPRDSIGWPCSLGHGEFTDDHRVPGTKPPVAPVKSRGK